MKKLIYNKVTHELEFIEKKTLKEKMFKVMVKILKILPSAFIAGASIIISYVGLEVSQKVKEIYESQLEIMENDREPYFSIEHEPIGDTPIEKYIIYNDGGRISGAELLNVITEFRIKTPNIETKKIETYIIYCEGKFTTLLNPEYKYNEEKKQFEFHKDKTDRITNCLNDLQIAISSELDTTKYDPYKDDIGVFVKDVIIIEYINYKNERCVQTFQFFDTGGMAIQIDNLNDDITVLDEINLLGEDIEEVTDYIWYRIKDNKTNDINFKQFQGFFSRSNPGKEGALLAAKKHLSSETISYGELLRRLVFEEGYSQEEAIYAADNCGTDWNERAVEYATMYAFGFDPDKKANSRFELIKKLVENEGFTEEQAIYAADQIKIKYNWDFPKK